MHILRILNQVQNKVNVSPKKRLFHRKINYN